MGHRSVCWRAARRRDVADVRCETVTSTAHANDGNPNKTERRRGRVDVTDDALFRRLVESVREYAIFLLDPLGYVLTWNPGAQRIKGYSAQEIIGQHFGRFYPEGTTQEKLDGELSQAVAEGQFEEENWRVRRTARSSGPMSSSLRSTRVTSSSDSSRSRAT